MKQFKIGKEYHFDKIQNAEHDSIAYIDHDYSFAIGQAICLLVNYETDETATFIMTGFNQANGAYYKCVYNDTQNPVS